MSDNMLIFGKGFIGQRLTESFGCAVSERKIFSFRDAEEEFERFRPAVIINCIGHTGASNVDGCEQDIDGTLTANTSVPIILAELALRKGIKLIHISSGCIYHFDYHGQAPLTEEDAPDFFGLFYSRTKIYAERALQALSQQSNILMVRIRIPLDDRPHPRNILTKLLSFKRIVDIPNSITYIPDFIQALRHLIVRDARGIYNVVNKGDLRYPELLEIYRKYKPDFKFSTMNINELNLIRTNALLSPEKLEKSGFKVRDIHEVLEECVKNYLNC